MILIKYALLLSVLFSVVVPQPGDSGKGKEIATVPENQNVPQASGNKDPYRISLAELVKLRKEIPKSKEKPMPYWPPVIGGVYWTEPFNTVSMGPFSTQMS